MFCFYYHISISWGYLFYFITEFITLFLFITEKLSTLEVRFSRAAPDPYFFEKPTNFSFIIIIRNLTHHIFISWGYLFYFTEFDFSPPVAPLRGTPISMPQSWGAGRTPSSSSTPRPGAGPQPPAPHCCSRIVQYEDDPKLQIRFGLLPKKVETVLDVLINVAIILLSFFVKIFLTFVKFLCLLFSL